MTEKLRDADEGEIQTRERDRRVRRRKGEIHTSTTEKGRVTDEQEIQTSDMEEEEIQRS